MALSRVNQFDDGTVFTEAKQEGEFDNIYNNALSLISPLTGNLDAGSNDITALDELAFTDAVTGASATGRLRRNGNSLSWNDLTGSGSLQMLLGGGIFGLTLSNDVADATNDIDIAVGAAVNSTQTTMLRLTSALVKQLDVAWAVGTNAGGRMSAAGIANTTYHVFIIQRVDTGVVDIGFDTSATAPTMPANYTLFRRIGSIIRAAGAILAFTQDGDDFSLTTPVLDVSAVNPGVAAVTRNLTVPAGINVYARVNWGLNNTAANAQAAYISDLAVTDQAPSSTVAPGASFNGSVTSAVTVWAQLMTRTNTSAQVRSRLQTSDANSTLSAVTCGWIDRRGRNA